MAEDLEKTQARTVERRHTRDAGDATARLDVLPVVLPEELDPM